MALNTRIRGAQIQLSEEVFAVADKLAFIDADGVMKQDAWADIATAVAGDGIQNTANQFAVDVSDFAGEGVEDDGSENLRVKLDGATLARSASGIKVTAGGISGTELNASVAGVGLSGGGGSALAVDLNELTTEATFAPGADYVGIVDAGDSGSDKTLWSVIATAIAGTGLTATAGVLAVDAVTDNIVEADIKVENLSADIDVTGYAGIHTLTNIPVTNSVQVFLRGLLQEEGSGKDYTLGGTGNKTITFATAPVSGDNIIVHYILND